MTTALHWLYVHESVNGLNRADRCSIRPGSNVASLADALLARHAIFPPQRTEERLRHEPKERLRGRLVQT